MSRDFLWPTTAQLAREVATSKRIAAWDAERRNREARRAFVRDLCVALFLIGVGCLLLWVAAPVMMP